MWGYFFQEYTNHLFGNDDDVMTATATATATVTATDNYDFDGDTKSLVDNLFGMYASTYADNSTIDPSIFVEMLKAAVLPKLKTDVCPKVLSMFVKYVSLNDNPANKAILKSMLETYARKILVPDEHDTTVLMVAIRYGSEEIFNMAYDARYAVGFTTLKYPTIKVNYLIESINRDGFMLEKLLELDVSICPKFWFDAIVAAFEKPNGAKLVAKILKVNMSGCYYESPKNNLVRYLCDKYKDDADMMNTITVTMINSGYTMTCNDVLNVMKCGDVIARRFFECASDHICEVFDSETFVKRLISELPPSALSAVLPAVVHSSTECKFRRGNPWKNLRSYIESANVDDARKKELIDVFESFYKTLEKKCRFGCLFCPGRSTSVATVPPTAAAAASTVDAAVVPPTVAAAASAVVSTPAVVSAETASSVENGNFDNKDPSDSFDIFLLTIDGLLSTVRQRIGIPLKLKLDILDMIIANVTQVTPVLTLLLSGIRKYPSPKYVTKLSLRLVQLNEILRKIEAPYPIQCYDNTKIVAPLEQLQTEFESTITACAFAKQ